MTYLDCEDDAITDLSAVNSLPNITKLYCRNNKLSTLRIEDKPKLTHVRAYGNRDMLSAVIRGNPLLTDIDTRDCTALVSMSCYNNSLTSLIVEGNTALESLNCGDNQLSSVNVSTLTNLKTLYCLSNPLTSLNVSNNSKLEVLDCHNTHLTTLSDP